MADQKLTELDEEISPAGTDLVYVVTDPDGTAEGKKVQISNLPGGGGGGSSIGSTEGDATAEVTTFVNGIGEAFSQAASRSEANGGWREARATSFASDGGAGWYLTLEAGITQVEVIAAEVEDDAPAKMGFFGATPVVRPQIDGSTATVADLCAALHALGAIEDTSL